MNQLTTKKDTSPFSLDGDNLQNNVESVFFENLTDDIIQNSQDVANLANFYASDSLLTPIDSITDEQLILEAANVFGTLDLSDNQETPDFSPNFKASYFSKPVHEKDINHKTPASTCNEESTKTDTDDVVSVTETPNIITLKTDITPIIDTTAAASTDNLIAEPTTDVGQTAVYKIALFTGVETINKAIDTISNTEPDVISEQPNADLTTTPDTTIDVIPINIDIIGDSLLYITDLIVPEIAICVISPPINSSEETSDTETNIDSNQPATAPEISTETINSNLSATDDSATDTVQIDSGIIENPSITSDIALDSFLNDMPTMWICYLPALETISMPAIDVPVYSDAIPVSLEPVQLIGQSSDYTQI